jgi:hypothetical protein
MNLGFAIWRAKQDEKKHLGKEKKESIKKTAHGVRACTVERHQNGSPSTGDN